MEAVVVVDMLNDFVTGQLECERAEKIIPYIEELIQAARRKKVPVIYSNDAHLPKDFELEKWGKHAMKGAQGAEVIPQLKPEKGDYIIEKRSYSGFFETGLDSLLRSLEVDTLVLTGLHVNMCVRHTAAGAFFRGYKTVVPKDGTEAFTEEDYQEGIEYLQNTYDTEITETKKIIRRWKE